MNCGSWWNRGSFIETYAIWSIIFRMKQSSSFKLAWIRWFQSWQGSSQICHNFYRWMSFSILTTLQYVLDTFNMLLTRGHSHGTSIRAQYVALAQHSCRPILSTKGLRTWHICHEGQVFLGIERCQVSQFFFSSCLKGSAFWGRPSILLPISFWVFLFCKFQ